ncbi:MAG: PilZ domain-containing protein [bacterium]|nr:PilZ domain-containing protein [bacterium]
MSASPRRENHQITPDSPARGIRREERREGLRQVDYSPFPRMTLDAGGQLGLLVNESDSGLCLVANETEQIGTLLRVVVRGLHGQTSRDVVARVVWCKQSDSGRCRIGLERLRESQPQMLRVRHIDGRRVRR